MIKLVVLSKHLIFLKQIISPLLFELVWNYLFQPCHRPWQAILKNWQIDDILYCIWRQCAFNKEISIFYISFTIPDKTWHLTSWRFNFRRSVLYFSRGNQYYNITLSLYFCTTAHLNHTPCIAQLYRCTTAVNCAALPLEHNDNAPLYLLQKCITERYTQKVLIVITFDSCVYGVAFPQGSCFLTHQLILPVFYNQTNSHTDSGKLS